MHSSYHSVVILAMHFLFTDLFLMEYVDLRAWIIILWFEELGFLQIKRTKQALALFLF